MKNKTNILAVIAVLLVTIALSASFLHNRPTYMSDTVTYIEGAKSLASGEGYFSEGSPITTWPPGYSSLLACPIRCGFDSILAFKILNVGFATLTVGILLIIFVRFISVWKASALALSIGAFFPWIYYTHTILADIPFAASVTAFALCCVLYIEKGCLRYLIGASLLCAIAPLIRSAGIALIPVLIFVTFVSSCSNSSRFNRHRLLFTAYSLLPAALALAVWFFRNIHLTGSALGYSVGVTPEYALSLEKIGITDPGLFDRIWVNIRGYLHIFIVPDQVGIARITNLNIMITLVCAVLWFIILLGFIRNLVTRKGQCVCLLFFSYMGILLLNTWYDIRYLLPVLGLCFFFLFSGISLLIDLVTRIVGLARINDLLKYGFLLIFLLANLALTGLGPQGKTLRCRTYRGGLQRMYKACLFIKETKTSGNLLVAGGAGFVPLWSGRKVVSLLGRLDEDRALISFDIPDNVGFLLLTESKFAPYREKYMEPLVEANTNRLTEVFRDGETVVYRVVR